MSKDERKACRARRKAVWTSSSRAANRGRSKNATIMNRGLVLYLLTSGKSLRKAADLLIFASTSPSRG